MSQSDNPYRPPVAGFGEIHPWSDAVDLASVSRRWKETFRLIELAGGPGLPRLRVLNLLQRLRVVFNWPCFFLGPFYYFIKGMWRKGLVVLVLGTFGPQVLYVLGHAKSADAFTFILGASLAMCVNVDYYRKVVLGVNAWW